MNEQWSVSDSGISFMAVGKTVKELPPGMYDVVATQQGLVWQRAEMREDEIIRFPDSPVDEVVSELEKFWAKEELFKAHGLSFKRGILLHGPPGSGKSSTLALVAQQVIRSGGIVIQFSSTFVGAYRQLRSMDAEVPIVALMEDLDEILEASREQSTLLNILDGAEALHKVVFLATTNYPEKLKERVQNRPSRFDRKIKIPHPGADSRRLYLETIVLPEDDVDIDRLVRDTDGMSLAHLKELFISTYILGTPYETTLKHLKAMETKASSVFDEEEFTQARTGQYA